MQFFWAYSVSKSSGKSSSSPSARILPTVWGSYEFQKIDEQVTNLYTSRKSKSLSIPSSSVDWYNLMEGTFQCNEKVPGGPHIMSTRSSGPQCIFSKTASPLDPKPVLVETHNRVSACTWRKVTWKRPKSISCSVNHPFDAARNHFMNRIWRGQNVLLWAEREV